MLGISRGRSEFLDFVRWASACLVLVGHAQMIRDMLLGGAVNPPGRVYAYLSSHSHIAVMFFFVLSGYLIGYAVHSRQARAAAYGFRTYMLDRWSRIYSVLVVAVALTLLLDAIGAAYSGNYAVPALLPQDHFWVRLLVNLASMQGLLGHRVQLGSNPALWSIGYEFCYYLAFGLIHFRAALFRRRASFVLTMAIMALLAGWHMSAYFLIWLMGYAAFRLHHLRGARLPLWAIVPIGALLVAANHGLAYLNLWQWPAFAADCAIALLFAAALLCDFGDRPSAMARFHAYMADFSYSIYAYHMPLIFFVYSLVPVSVYAAAGATASGLLVSLFCILCGRGLYHVSEARRSWLRARAQQLWPRRAAAEDALRAGSG